MIISDLARFYDDKKSIIWKLQIEHNGSITHGTGFSLRRPNLVITTNQYFLGKENCSIYLCSLGQYQYKLKARRVHTRKKFNLSLLELDSSSGTSCKLALDVSLCVGDNVIGIGYQAFPSEGFLIVGEVAFPSEQCDFKIKDLGETCREYETSPIIEEKYPTRVIGDFWNKQSMPGYIKDTAAGIPVIQIRSFEAFCYRNGQLGPLAAGSPVFDLKGEVIGMIAGASLSHVFAIHCAVLEEFMEYYISQEKTNQRKHNKRTSGSTSNCNPKT